MRNEAAHLDYGPHAWKLSRVGKNFRAAGGNAVKHLVAKLVKSFGRLRYAAESFDDFRYTKACLYQKKIGFLTLAIMGLFPQALKFNTETL